MDKFDEIYSRYLKDVYRFLLKLSGSPDTAEEITQQTFAAAFEKLDTFRGECRLSVWLCQIAKHEFFAWEKKNRRLKPLGDEAETASESRTLDDLIDREDAGQIMRILHELQEPYKEVFMLRVMGEMPFRDIGQLFGKGESWGRVTYYRAKKMICERIGGGQMKESLFESEEERASYLDEKKLLEDGKKVIVEKEKERLGFWARIMDALINLAAVLWAAASMREAGVQAVFDYDGLVYILTAGFFGTFLVGDLLYFLFTAKGKPASVTGPLTGSSIAIKAGVMMMGIILSCVMGWIKVVAPMMDYLSWL